MTISIKSFLIVSESCTKKLNLEKLTLIIVQVLLYYEEMKGAYVMCGFVGCLTDVEKNTESNCKDKIKEMNDMIVHRGPDDEGYFEDKTLRWDSEDCQSSTLKVGISRYLMTMVVTG